MIGFLKGRVVYKNPERILLEVNGIGFSIWITLNTYYALKEGEDVLVHTYQHVGDGEVSLYGFVNENEKSVFELLLKVPGIGPKLARNILSGITADELTNAVAKKDVARLLKVPGIGKKLAEKIVFTLKEYCHETVKGEEEEVWEKIRSSLTNLGFKAQEVGEVLEVLKERFEKIDLETGVKEALRILGGRVGR
jgi:Holliday junction DNA helicase RuvA